MKNALLLFLFLTSLSSFSQFKITGYFDTEIGISYAISDKLQTEVRFNDNLNIEFNAEVSLLYKVTSKEAYNINFGVGISTFPFHSDNINLFESLYTPLQIETTPFKDARNIGLVLESAYHFSDVTDASGIRNSIGIRYIFN